VSPLIAKEVFDSGLAKKNLHVLLGLGVVWLFMVLGGSVVQYFYSVILVRVTIESTRKLKAKVLRSVMFVFSTGVQTQETQGEKISRVLTDPDVFVQRCGISSWMSAISSGATFLIVGSLSIYLDWQMAVICIVSAVLSLASQHRTPQKLVRSNQEVASLRAHVTGIVENILSTWRTIIRYGKIGQEIRYADEGLLNLADANVKAQKQQRAAILLNDAIVGPIPIFLLWFGAYRVFSGVITLGTLMAFLSYLRIISSSFGGIFQSILQISSGIGQAKYFLPLISQQPDNKDIKSCAEKGLLLNVELDNVMISADSFTLCVDHLKLERAKTYRIVGNSGAGKSVFLEFLAGIRKASEGNILWNGRACTLGSFKNKARGFGYIRRNETLFHRSVWDNVSYGSDVAKYAKPEYEIDTLRMKDKLLFPTVNLSSGEIQRVHVLRELARRPEVYIIDEGLDAFESDLQTVGLRLIREVIPEAIVIICTHNWKECIEIDKTICISNGHVYQEFQVGSSGHSGR
jgi:ABC-type multidrug transport system fused ATPase/permease subunit